jgi:ATP-dependent exoDNAse (exonuclease V) alpha subunit
MDEGTALNEGQKTALLHLSTEDNVFITGGAGTGKSFLLKKFLRNVDSSKLPVLASTGAAAVLIGGRTFHSFFGLGILEGGPDAAVERALKDRRVVRRLKRAKGFVLDEISMIPGVVLETAERIASGARDDPRPWGGLKVVAVGDFAQLPPVSRESRKRDWAFLNPVWERSAFRSVYLKEMMRSKGDEDFNSILGDVREGVVSERVRNLLDWRSFVPGDDDFEGSVLHARKADVDRVNLQKLALLEGEARAFETEYTGEGRLRDAIMAHAPVPETLELKKGAFVMIRQNDPQGRWVNGSLGHIRSMDAEQLEIRLLGGNTALLEKTRFSMLDAEGNETASAKNFPVNLAYAVTIHKSQGATLDRIIVSLSRLWEPGQAYVAISRVRSSEGLMITGWDAGSIFADPQVREFHRRIEKEAPLL